LKFGIKHGYNWYGLIFIVVVYAIGDIAYPFYVLNDEGADLFEEYFMLGNTTHDIIPV